ncbi:MAG TPA: carbohydrate ABC transporter substrate-binding protein, partial [Sphaerochaeta sp.]|nr:carbohydrate ABC transporter substrate-binding protein [Sphaerochaeta sp.]
NVGTENYLCINSQVSAEKQALADQFLTWLFSSDTGKAIVKNDLMFITPFNTFKDHELPTDPLAKEVIRWMNKDGVSSMPWAFSVIPSGQWKTDFGADLGQYINGKMSWSDVAKRAVASWKTEYDLTK